ncbi:MAG: hypothetical protein ABR875_03980 [Minisyncoccia bacterium]
MRYEKRIKFLKLRLKKAEELRIMFKELQERETAAQNRVIELSRDISRERKLHEDVLITLAHVQNDHAQSIKELEELKVKAASFVVWIKNSLNNAEIQSIKLEGEKEVYRSVLNSLLAKSVT